MDNDARTPEEIERDIARERAALGETLGTINDRMSFDALSRDLLEQMRAAGLDQARELSNDLMQRARANPLPALVVGAGLAWWVLGTQPAQGSRAPSPAPRPVTPAPPPAPEFRSDRPAAAAAMSEHGGGDATGTLEELRRRIAEGTEDLTEAARERVLKARKAALDAVGEAADSARRGARQVTSTIADNPVVFGAAALALGAAVAGVIAKRRADQAARERRNALFSEADRIMREERDRAVASNAGAKPDMPTA